MARLRENFAANLKRLLQERDLKQKVFAADLEVSGSTVSQWLNCVVFPEDDKLERIARYFRVTYEDLVRDPASNVLDSDPVLRFLRDQARARGYELVKKRL